MVEEKKKVGRPRKKDEVEKAREDTEKELEERESLPEEAKPLIPQFINATNFRFVDISFEFFREYVYPNGAKLRIENPIRLSVAANNTHRVTDVRGLNYHIAPGWLSIISKSRPGTPNFIM